jgi:15-cis-phytoene synthase
MSSAASAFTGDIDLDFSYEYCVRVAREQARNFYYSFLVLPAEKRRAFCAIYAFMRHSDDISDDLPGQETSPAAERQGKLSAWRTRFEWALSGKYGNSPILPAFHDTLKRFAIPSDYFFELLRGAEMDVQGAQYKSFDDLYRYCYRVAGVVGLTCIHIFGFPREQDERACQLAESCGVAFQLTNILRDLREDAAAGRVYLPSEDMERFGVDAAALNRENPGEAVENLMRFEIARAWGYYREAQPLLALVSRDSRASLWAMIALYSGILKHIEADPLAVFRGRVGLSKMEKLGIVGRALCIRVRPRIVEEYIGRKD